MSDPNLGRVLKNRYQLMHLVGQGAMGRVYAALDLALGGVPVAIKFLAQTLLSQRMRDRFEREAKTCAQLGQKSIHIIRVTDYGVDDSGVPFYVMEYLTGDNLSEILSRQVLSLPRFLSLTRQICLGLQCAHQGIVVEGELYPIVHRDIKPGNILVSQNESLGELAKILDFGIAKVLQSGEQQTNSFMGTLAYSSPEQMEGRELDSRSDIYSLGVLMFQMLTGKMPLQADTHTFGGWYKAHHFSPPRSIESVNTSIKVPKALETLVMGCLSKSATQRPQSVTEVLTALAPMEERYGTGRQIAQRIEASLLRLPVSPPTRSTSFSDEAYQTAAWPDNMPIADIVFPKIMDTSSGTTATLWVMLPKPEIEKRLVCTRYNQFLFLEAPHPMALWLTVLFNRSHGPRWLPCYLDLKTLQGQQMTRLLGQLGRYSILFFAQELPQRCHNMQIATIAEAQRKLLKDWAGAGQLARSATNPTISKDHLKGALESLKPQILVKLEALTADDRDLSNGNL